MRIIFLILILFVVGCTENNKVDPVYTKAVDEVADRRRMENVVIFCHGIQENPDQMANFIKCQKESFDKEKRAAKLREQNKGFTIIAPRCVYNDEQRVAQIERCIKAFGIEPR